MSSAARTAPGFGLGGALDVNSEGGSGDFDYLEPLLSLREVVLRIALQSRVGSLAKLSRGGSGANAVAGGDRGGEGGGGSSSSAFGSSSLTATEAAAAAVDDIDVALKRHLFLSLRLARESARPSNAFGPLQRLNALITLTTPPEALNGSFNGPANGGGPADGGGSEYRDGAGMTLKLRVEEARLFWAQGDSGNAGDVRKPRTTTTTTTTTTATHRHDQPPHYHHHQTWPFALSSRC